MKNKQIIGMIRMSEADVSGQAFVHMDNSGADAVYLIDDLCPPDEERVIKLIKTVNAKSDLPVFVKRDYKRLEDVKKIIYAGNTRVVMDTVLDEDFSLMKEASERFGKDNVIAWLPLLQVVDENLAEQIQSAGASGCMMETVNGADILNTYGLSAYMLTRKNQPEDLAELLKTNGIEGVISEAFYKDDVDFMGLKSELMSHLPK